MSFSEDMGTLPINSTAVAIDKDKHSQFAVKWAIDHLLSGNNFLILVHVRQRNPDGSLDFDPQHIFIPYRGYCARKSVQVKEVILDDSDVAKAILDYVNSNFITNIVIGASTRNALVKTFKKLDVPSHVTKCAPEFCSVYVIAKAKVLSVRSAQRPVVNTPIPLKLSPSVVLTHQHSVEHASFDDLHSRTPSLRGSNSNPAERNNDSSRGGRQAMLGGSWKGSVSMENIDISGGSVSNRSSLSDDDHLDHFPFCNMHDVPAKELDFSFVGGVPRREDTHSPNNLEAEMRRLRLELKQTMDMYSSACKEAITAKQKAKELTDWKTEELRKFEQTRYSEESAFAMVEMEKARCKAAVEAAEAAQKLAEKEAQKRKFAEIKAKQEADEKNRALSALAQNDVRYRKYTIDEIEVATEKFSPHFKVGEGGYGPVYKGRLDHTPVAIKVLRPDAAQGRRQFQQEVEVLSCMRHPHMVLLLGACPEYGCLVYEYMNYGSLEDRLLRKNGTPPIPWRIRFKIAAEISIALAFLHQAKPEPLVHRDLKPANILLDRNYVSKISDVGLARLVPPSVANSVTQYHMTSAAGTFCYIDPEYQQTGMLTTKSDVYSLGIMLLQIITAKPAMGLSHYVQRSIETGTFPEMLDPAVHDWPIEEALSFAQMALKCCELRKRDRPDLSTVVLPELCRLRDFGMTEDPNNFYAYQPVNHIPIPRPRSSMGQGNSNTSSSSHQRSPYPGQGGPSRTSPLRTNPSWTPSQGSG
ncbi:U-box domain-containing protein 52-like isoform X1 [Amaranthus tricolor]|uniref:U-box domain-containing protein 52-like isoform X1 n=1 Tax=Amaranthus tricolor TaxID=29722 RepID=UPI0025878323|nr:U-box domain-containing protein 52-like isoform X1 [Amaranthus tricolor]